MSLMNQVMASEEAQAEREAYVEMSNRANKNAWLGAALGFVAALVTYSCLVWLAFQLTDDAVIRLAAAIGVGCAVVVACIWYFALNLHAEASWSVAQGNVIYARLTALEENRSKEQGNA